MGTKSLAITVKLWPSMENFWIPSAPALINRSLCFFPGVNLKLVIPALLLHGVLSPAATVEQLKLFRPSVLVVSVDSEDSRGISAYG